MEKLELNKNENFRLEKFKKIQPITIVEYAENCMRKFDELSFNVVDSLILSQLSYMNIGCIVPYMSENEEKNVKISSLYKAEYFAEMTEKARDPLSNRKLLNAICASPRYRDIEINYYTCVIDDSMEKQFSAVTFFIPDGNIYIAYRGTDTTIVGWKEDFNMAFEPVVPSHISAVEYLKNVAKKTDRNLYIGGHSKGGNLALFAAAFSGSEIQKRIVKVYNHDGPGLSSEIRKSKQYVDLSDKTETTLPEASIFGLIFNSGDYKVVQSKRLGIMQHDPFSWEIMDNDFIYAEEVTHASSGITDITQELLDSLSEEDREIFVDSVYKIIRSSGAKSVVDWPIMVKEFDRMINTAIELDDKTEETIKKVISESIKVLGKHILNWPDEEKWKKIKENFEFENTNNEKEL